MKNFTLILAVTVISLGLPLNTAAESADSSEVMLLAKGCAHCAQIKAGEKEGPCPICSKKKAMKGHCEHCALIKAGEKEGPCPICSKKKAKQETRATQNASLIAYSETAFADAKDAKRVLFFHASWCPSCVNSAKAINNLKLPEDVKVFKVDYDSSGDLKKKYGVVFQDTFVQVDEKGNKVKLWSGNAKNLLKQLK